MVRIVLVGFGNLGVHMNGIQSNSIKIKNAHQTKKLRIQLLADAVTVYPPPPLPHAVSPLWNPNPA
jgi:hypothetical protein